MYRLVIAEKPSVAMSIAKVLGATARKEGHMEGGGWLISWCIGHLAGLAEPAVYNPGYDKWRREDLPILPESWRFTIGKDKREQFDILRTLLRREDVSEVVNACDAGREGELIFRTAYHLAGCTKPMKRLWISSMEDSAIREGFDNLRPGSDYDGLHQAALCRQKADWLVGINATRLFSVLYGRTLNIGRVMSPTLALIAQREAEIAAFEPVPFYTVELACGGMTLTGERISGKEGAAAIATACEGSTVTIQTVERREKSEKAPALYDLTTLQRDANRILGYTAQETLDYLQALYEKKLCTYPRTDSRYLTDDMENAVPNLVSIAATLCGVKAAGTVSAAQVCSSKKVSDHHAIVPTPSAATVDLASLPLGEREILRLVSLALVRAVCPPYRYAETVVTADCGGQTFTVKGKAVLDMGWRACAALPKDAALPDGLAENQTLAVDTVQVAQSVPLKEYVYKMEANPRTVGAIDQQFIQAYERTAQGTLKPDRVLFFGTADKCAGILKKLQSGELKPDDFFQPGTARISHYKTKDGAELDAFVGPDDKVYMGRRDHYDNRSHYLNADKSLLYLSNNTVMFDFVSGSSYAATQAELLAQGCFTMEDYAEFDALRVGVLAQFEQVGQLLFAGEPFSFIQPDAAEVEQQPPPAPEPLAQADEALRDNTLDEYPLPDPAFPADELEQNYGYAGGDLLPLSRERAVELLEQDLTVYMMESGENPAMVFDRDDLVEQPDGMMFAVPRKEWEESPEFHQCIVDRLNHQKERERAFLDYGGDCFAIYQIKDGAEQRDLRFMNMDWLMSKGLTVERGNYDLVYTGELAPGLGSSALEKLWERFNTDHPADYHRPSMSVSDIIAVKQDGVVSCHYCDSFGFEQLTDFISQKPTVAELEAQVKAGQTISLTDLADAVHREKKKSVVAQLKNQPTQERKKAAPKKSAEKER